jgi:TnsA endonuclease N terminal
MILRTAQEVNAFSQRRVTPSLTLNPANFPNVEIKMDIVHPRAGTPAFRDPAPLNDALLGLACDENREAWESLSATATMVLSKSGGSIRTIVTGRRIITTGVYASRKTGCGHPYESMLEKAFFMLCEVDTDVVDYRAQPFRFEFVIGGVKRAYLPDAVTLRADGVVEVIEIKRDAGDLRDPEYRLKLQAVREICDRIGWRFRVLFRTDLTEPSRFFRAVEDVQSWAFTKFNDAEVFEVVRQLRLHGPLPVGQLAECFDERLRGLAKLKAMMVGRIVRLDLTNIPNDSTPVTLVEGPQEELQ